MLSRTITSTSADRNSEYTHNEGHKDIIKDCEDILLELGLHYIYIVFNVNCYLFMYSANNCTVEHCHFSYNLPCQE